MVWRRLRLFVAVAEANPYRLADTAELSLRKLCGVEGYRAQPQGVRGTSGWLKCLDMDSQLPTPICDRGIAQYSAPSVIPINTKGEVGIHAA